jgi:hypothetical protein
LKTGTVPDFYILLAFPIFILWVVCTNHLGDKGYGAN